MRVLGGELLPEELMTVVRRLTPLTINEVSIVPAEAKDIADLVVVLRDVPVNEADLSEVEAALAYGRVIVVPISVLPQAPQGDYTAVPAGPLKPHERITIQSHRFGTIVTRGSVGETNRHLYRETTCPRVMSNELWPGAVEDDDVFAREAIDVVLPEDLTTSGIIVSRANAVPVGCDLSQARAVWVAGQTTWEKLRKAGIWVNGSFDSLGEDTGFHELFADVKWYKFSHQDAEAGGSILIPTYKLVPRTISGDIASRKAFFWKSGSLFKYVSARYPAILSASHACGLGHTYDAIAAQLSDKRLDVFLSLDEWRDHCSITCCESQI